LKNKKTKNIFAISGACVLLAFSVVAFPFILAASPGNRGITTITSEDVFPTETTMQSSETELHDEAEQICESDTIPNINAISEELAIAIATEAVPNRECGAYWINGEIRTFTHDFLEAKYMESTDQVDDPTWYVLFLQHCKGVLFEYIPVGYNTPEEYLSSQLNAGYDVSLGTDRNGVTVGYVPFDYINYIVVEVNALTGKFTRAGTIITDVTSLDGFSCWDDLKQNMTYEEVVPLPGPASED